MWMAAYFVEEMVYLVHLYIGPNLSTQKIEWLTCKQNIRYECWYRNMNIFCTHDDVKSVNQ